MNLWQALVAQVQAAVLGNSRQRALHHPPATSQARARLHLLPGDAGHDAAA